MTELAEAVSDLAEGVSDLAEAGPWTSIGVQGFAAGRFGAAATAAEYGIADRCGIAARVLAARGRAACALLLAHSAVATAERTDSTGGQGLAYLDLAHTYLALGDGRAARAAATDARRSFVRKEHLVGVARADQLLTTTSG